MKRGKICKSYGTMECNFGSVYFATVISIISIRMRKKGSGDNGWNPILAGIRCWLEIKLSLGSACFASITIIITTI